MIPLARHRRFALLALVALILAGCGATGPTSSPPAPSASAISSPDLTPPGGTTQPSGPVKPAPPTQTDTEWGRIWDALPPSFPVPADAIPDEPFEGPASGAFAVGAAPLALSQELLARFHDLGFSAESLDGPLEDGSLTMNLVAEQNDACVVQVRLTPLSGTTRMVVMYAAQCPFE